MLQINGQHFLTQSKLVDYSRRLPLDPWFWLLISGVEEGATPFPDLLVLILPYNGGVQTQLFPLTGVRDNNSIIEQPPYC